MLLKQKEIFDKLADKRLEEITSLDKKVKPDNLLYRYKGTTVDVKFDELDNTFNLIDEIREREINLAEVKTDQIRIKSNLGEINKVNKKQKKRAKKKKKNTLPHIEMHYKLRKNAIKFLMIMFQWYMKQKMKQLKEQGFNY